MRQSTLPHVRSALGGSVAGGGTGQGLGPFKIRPAHSNGAKIAQWGPRPESGTAPGKRTKSWPPSQSTGISQWDRQIPVTAVSGRPSYCSLPNFGRSRQEQLCRTDARQPSIRPDTTSQPTRSCADCRLFLSGSARIGKTAISFCKSRVFSRTRFQFAYALSVTK